MMLKLNLALLFIVAGVHCSKLSEVLLDELIDEYKERRDDHDWDYCHHTGLECTRCSACHDATQGAMCIKGATERQCLCNWGWTGHNAARVPNAHLGKWSPNRIRADDCRTPCHYTHDHWNAGCLGEGETCNDRICPPSFGSCVDGVCVGKCDEVECLSKYGICEKGKCVCDEDKCGAKGGKCVDGECKIRCCRNAMKNIIPYSRGSFEMYCNGRCEYVSINRGCEPLTPPCNPMCKLSGGFCHESTGRCECCKDFTGPHPLYENGVISATHCGVWCPHKLPNGSRNKLCVNPDWVVRAETNQKKKVMYNDRPPF